MEKKFITDKQGNKVLPITHVSAVLDDSGNDLDSHLGAFEDEVRGLVDTPHQNYVTVATYASLPASGSADTIYRVSNYNGSTSQVDVTSYSEYAWNGSSYTFLCVKSQIGEVFDISVYNNNAKYADLAAALNGGANIPQSLQKGGMSIKFVHTSDNKYVQYRLMNQNWSTTESDWQGVDEEPIAGSDNLVKSGGVYPTKAVVDYAFSKTENIFTKLGIVVGIINSSGNIVEIPGLPNVQTSDFLPVKPSSTYYCSKNNGARMGLKVVGYYNNGVFIDRTVPSSTIDVFTTPANCTHIRVSVDDAFAGKCIISENGRSIYVPPRKLTEVGTQNDEDIERLCMVNYGLQRCIEQYCLNFCYIKNTNVWEADIYCASFIIPVKENQSLYIEGGNYDCVFAFLTSQKCILNVSPDFIYQYRIVVDPITGEESWELVEDEHGNPVIDTRHECKRQQKVATKLPPGTKFLYISAKFNFNGVSTLNLPNQLKIDGISYIFEEETNVEVEKPTYTTIFFDDFETLSRDIWTLHTEEPVDGNGYNSRFKSNENNAYVEQSCLVLNCSKTATAEDGTYIDKDGNEAQVQYIAPYISTCDSFVIPEGRVSARMKFSKGIVDGMFPGGFWTFGQNALWAQAHEMDICETVAGISIQDSVAKDGTLIPAGSHLSYLHHNLIIHNDSDINKSNQTYLKINWALYSNGIYQRSVDYVNRVDTTEWHVYSVEWDRENVTFFIDDNPVISYTAENLRAVNMDGEIGFFYPQDIRFNIKASKWTTGNNGYLFVDWVKAEVLDATPCLSMTNEDVELGVGDSYYISPTFNNGCSNKAFTVEIEDDGVLTYQKYLNDSSQMVTHTIIGANAGNTTVTLRSVNGRTVCQFNVSVS